jgi:DNA-binding MarR family transcriptional regulator
LLSLTGDVDPTGLQVLRLVKRTANLYESVIEGSISGAHLSGPRWHMLMRLWAQEQRFEEGLSPSDLSRCLSVSRNTVSALLRGLEERGLIERELDLQDRRGFCIRLSRAGRALIRESAPAHMAFLNRLVDGLSAAEQAQLIDLLDKLLRSVGAHGGGDGEQDRHAEQDS